MCTPFMRVLKNLFKPPTFQTPQDFSAWVTTHQDQLTPNKNPGYSLEFKLHENMVQFIFKTTCIYVVPARPCIISKTGE